MKNQILVVLGVGILIMLFMINSSLKEISARVDEVTVQATLTNLSVQGLPYNFKNNGF